MTSFTIIVPAYNAEKYIEQSLFSIQNQSFEDFEVICVDDCSKDKTYKLINKFVNVDKRFRLLKTQRHIGPGFARNLALREAKGRYIACVDADDTVMKDFLILPFEKLEQTNVSAVWIKSLIFWENENKTTDMFNFSVLRDQKEGFLSLSPENIINYPAYSWNKMFRKNCINKNIKWTNDKLFEDVEFYWRFYTQNPSVYVIDKPLYIYRRHKSSIMSTCLVDKDYHKNLFYVTENIYHFLCENDLFEKYKKAFLLFVVQNINEFYSYPNLKTELAKTILKTLDNIDFPQKYTDLQQNLPNCNFDFSLI